MWRSRNVSQQLFTPAFQHTHTPKIFVWVCFQTLSHLTTRRRRKRPERRPEPSRGTPWFRPEGAGRPWRGHVQTVFEWGTLSSSLCDWTRLWTMWPKWPHGQSVIGQAVWREIWNERGGGTNSDKKKKLYWQATWYNNKVKVSRGNETRTTLPPPKNKHIIHATIDHLALWIWHFFNNKNNWAMKIKWVYFVSKITRNISLSRYVFLSHNWNTISNFHLKQKCLYQSTNKW